MIHEVVSILKTLPPNSQREILDFALFVQRQHRGKVEKRRRDWEKRHIDTDPPMYRGNS